MYKDFREDCIAELGEGVFNRIDEIIDGSDFINLPNTFKGISISVSREKIHSLQENVCIKFSCDEFNIELLFEDGISAGTQLNDYSINSDHSFIDTERTIEIVVDVEYDFEKADYLGIKYNKENTRNFFSVLKPKILDMIKNQDYDNYVTGGGTIVTDNFYNDFKNEMNKKNIFWKVITETKKIRANFV